MATAASSSGKGNKNNSSSTKPIPIRKSIPNPEVKEPQKRRKLTVEWKLEILRKFDAISDATERGIFLRKESLYQSQIYQWKREVRAGKLVAGKEKKRGPVSTKNPEMASLQKENDRLKKQLHQANLIIELQKKVAALFGETVEQ